MVFNRQSNVKIFPEERKFLTGNNNNNNNNGNNMKNGTVSRISLKTILFITFSIVGVCVFSQFFPFFCHSFSFGLVLVSLDDINDFLINQKIKPVDTSIRNKGHDYGYLNLGLHKMANSSVSIIGVAKNVAPKLPSVLKQISSLSDLFSFSRVIFVEGDSIDDTAKLLRNWVSISSINRTLITSSSVNITESSGHFSGISLPREGRITRARNIAMEHLKTLPRTKYVIVLDLDILGWDHWGVVDGFSRSGWDVMCSHGILLHGIYRDTYAFRSPGINTNHHWCGQDYSKYNLSQSDQKWNREQLQISQKSVQAKMSMVANSIKSPEFRKFLEHPKKIQEYLNLSQLYSDRFPFYSQGLMQVDSCFGGLALYKSELFDECDYSFRHEEAPYMLDCEHVLLHKCMKKKTDAKIFSNSHMKLWYGHNPFTGNNIQKYLKSFIHM